MIFHQTPKFNSRAVYLDNNSTTPLDPRVVAAMLPVLQQHFGNPASGSYTFGWYAEELVAIAREQVAGLIGATPEEIIFTSGATESNNLAIKGHLEVCGSTGGRRHCLSVRTEHKAVLDPLAAYEKKGVQNTLLEVQTDGTIARETFEQGLKPETVLISIMLANNEIGTIHDLRSLVAVTKDRPLLFHSDGTQAVGKIPLDVKSLGIDLLSLSAHKLYGPKGVGALYIRKKQRPIILEPLLHGGGHELGYRSGTLNVAGIVGFGEACRIAREVMADDAERIARLATLLVGRLAEEVGGVSLNGHALQRIPGNLNLAFDGVDASTLLGAVSTKLAVSAASACQTGSKKPSHVLEALGLDTGRLRSSIRLGIGRFTTEEEILTAVKVLRTAIARIRQK